MVNKIQSYSCQRALQSCTSAMGGAARHSPPAGCVWGSQRRGWHFCRIRSCAIGSCNSPLLDRRLWAAHPNSETDGLREDSRAVWVTTHGDEASDCHPERARFGPFASVKLRNSSACHRQGVPGRDSSERLRIRCGGVNAPQGWRRTAPSADRVVVHADDHAPKQPCRWRRGLAPMSPSHVSWRAASGLSLRT